MAKPRNPAEFIAKSPQVRDEMLKRYNLNLADGALRLVQINKQPVSQPKLGNHEAKIEHVLGSGTMFGIVAKNPDFVKAEVDAAVIKSEDVPEVYFKLQQRIAREQGYGDIEITDELRRVETETIQADQRASLEEWSNYLRDESNDQTYPAWFKVYAWQSMLKMGQFNKPKTDEKTGKHTEAHFEKRRSNTVALYPELNPEALAYVYD